ncbi:MAG TPA: hypothetical protein VFI54_18235 [Solirubrobacteraceae bacterium]|nr:hypothetical protein [Solirubrobacteraceae bacterium]
MGALIASREGVLVSAVLPVMVVGVRRDELLRVSNRHAAVPVFEERPGRYLGYFENKFGEQFVFVHEDGELDATVFHGDDDWEPRCVTDASGVPDVGDLVLNDEERAFVIACWIATAWRRVDARPARSAA